MYSADDEPLREFQYFDEDGVFIGKSDGATPDEQLFNQAHYVFDDHNDVVKNLDLLAIMRRRLLNLRRELVNVPVKQMERIMEINRQIWVLEQNIVEIQNQGWKRAG